MAEVAPVGDAGSVHACPGEEAPSSCPSSCAASCADESEADSEPLSEICSTPTDWTKLEIPVGCSEDACSSSETDASVAGDPTATEAAAPALSPLEVGSSLSQEEIESDGWSSEFEENGTVQVLRKVLQRRQR